MSNLHKPLAQCALNSYQGSFHPARVIHVVAMWDTTYPIPPFLIIFKENIMKNIVIFSLTFSFKFSFSYILYFIQTYP